MCVIGTPGWDNKPPHHTKNSWYFVLSRTGPLPCSRKFFGRRRIDRLRARVTISYVWELFLTTMMLPNFLFSRLCLGYVEVHIADAFPNYSDSVIFVHRVAFCWSYMWRALDNAVCFIWTPVTRRSPSTAIFPVWDATCFLLDENNGTLEIFPTIVCVHPPSVPGRKCVDRPLPGQGPSGNTSRASER